MPSIESLNYLATVAKTCSITQAAKTLNVTPSAISHSLKKLENELGVSLFNRTQVGIELTEAGTKLAALAQETTLSINKFISESKINCRNTAQSLVLICTNTGINNEILSFIMPTFFEHSIDVIIREQDTDDILKTITVEEDAMGLILATNKQAQEIAVDYDIEYLTSFQYYLNINKNSKWLKPGMHSVSLEDLLNIPLAILNSSSVIHQEIYLAELFKMGDPNISYFPGTRTIIELLNNDCIATVAIKRPFNRHDRTCKYLPIKNIEMLQLVAIYPVNFDAEKKKQLSEVWGIFF